MYMVRHLKVTRWAAWETAHEAGDFLPTWLGRLVAIWQIHWGNGISQKRSTKITLPKTRVSFFREGKLHKLLQAIKGLMVTTRGPWRWRNRERQFHGCGRGVPRMTPTCRPPNSPRSIHHFLVWIWARRNFVNMRYLKWKLDSPTPMHCWPTVLYLEIRSLTLCGRFSALHNLRGLRNHQEPSKDLTKGLQRMICTMCRAQLYS